MVEGEVEPDIAPETFVLSSYHSDFVRQYQSRHCYRLDPAANYIRQHQLPTPWGLHSFTGTQAEAMYRTAIKFGVCSGATFPVTPPVVTVAGFGYATSKAQDEALPADKATVWSTHARMAGLMTKPQCEP